jgi:hypothetical protein
MGGRLVSVHWRGPAPERPFTADAVHVVLRGASWLRVAQSEEHDEYLLDVLERR